jgi:hypothetical protein
MRFKLKHNLEPNCGDRRIVTKFLLFPIVIDNEFRWLEKVKIEQKYILSPFGYSWINKRFID